MEGQRANNPYSTPFSGRRFASDLIYNLGSSAVLGPASGPARFVDRIAGYPVRGATTDRWFGAQDARSLQDYNRYMQQQMRNDPGNRGGIANFFRSLFTRGGQDQQRAPQNNPYSATTYGIPGYSHGGQPTIDDTSPDFTGPPRAADQAENFQRVLEEMERAARENARNNRPPPHRSGGTPMRGRTVAQRMRGNSAESRANNRALESMAEGFLGQDPTSRMGYMNRLSRDMMERMYGNEFK